MRLLHVVATPRSHESNTVRVSNALLEQLYLKHDDLSVDVLDLFKADLPAVAGENIESKYKLMTGQELDSRHRSSWDAIEASIKRFLEADVYLLSVPMWNFGVPYALKYYIDAIVQPGYLFRYNEHGVPEGLVTGKRMIVVTSSGADYSRNSPLQPLDFVEPYLRTIFNFIGIADIHFVCAQPMDISAPLRRSALIRAIEDARLFVQHHWDTAPPVLPVDFPAGVKPKPLDAAVSGL
jgi:FMN-dependent NADH-azoreductase